MVWMDSRLGPWLEYMAQDKKSWVQVLVMLSTCCENDLPLQQASGLGGPLNRLAKCPPD